MWLRKVGRWLLDQPEHPAEVGEALARENSKPLGNVTVIGGEKMRLAADAARQRDEER